MIRCKKVINICVAEELNFLTLTMYLGKGPLSFSGKKSGGITQSLFTRFTSGTLTVLILSSFVVKRT